MTAAKQRADEPTTLASLNLPPTFVSDHCVRTLYYQGSMSPADIAKHWRVHIDIASEVVESLKGAAYLEAESGQAAFERLAKVKLTSLGQTQAANARSRTWYSGPLPVSVDDFGARMRSTRVPLADTTRVRDALASFFIDPKLTDQIGQAVSSGSTLALNGLSYDEQPDVARQLGASITGETQLPHAIYAAGAVIRVFDARKHGRISTDDKKVSGDADVLRSHDDVPSQWSRIARPLIRLSGGVHASDVVPAYNEDARFYLAPLPLAAYGGVLAVCDASSDVSALADLARLWLVPGRHGVGILLLRSGERIEVPWHAATVLFGATPVSLPHALHPALVYDVDVAALEGAALVAFLSARLDDERFPQTTVTTLASMIEQRDPTRTAAADAARYLLDRAGYEGVAFRASDDVLEAAVAFASASEAPSVVRRAA